jgi:plastocyanin domain-containing protein
MKNIILKLSNWMTNTPKERRYVTYFKFATVLMFVETIITKNGTYLFGLLACWIVLWRFSKFHARKKRDFTFLDLLWIRNRETKNK